MMKKITSLIFTLLLLVTIRSYSQDWTYVTSTGTTFILYGMSFPPGQGTVGFACGMQYTYDAPGVIVKTVDGGNNWTQIWPTSGEIDGLQAIWFTSDQVGYACGWNNYFIKTTDGGTTWNPITVGTDVWYYIDVEFWDANNGIALAKMNDPGNEQAAFITSNGGTTWAPATSGLATAEVMGLSYATQNTVFVVGSSGHVFRSTDGGHNWTTWATLSAMLLGVDFANANFGVVGGEENIFATNNGGATWTTYTTGYENFYATETFPDGTGYCGGTDENIYKTTDYGATWAMDYNGSGSSSLYRIRWTDTGIGFACGSQGRIIKDEPPVSADFTANPTTTCVGSQVNFYDNSIGNITSWSWTFQGGTPATSNVPNPVVTYNNAGTFDVQLTVSTGTNNSTEIKTDYITVIQSISQPDTPTGETATCGTYSYTYSTYHVVNANSYNWQVNPSSAGTITGSDTIGTFIASNTWSGAYTIKVRGVSACGPGPWSSDLSGTLYHDPIQFNLIGDGGYCEGGTGAEISQDGSETGINYELFKDNVTTGNIMPGTGSPISFGFYTETGLYTVAGTNGTHCAESMVGQIYVHMQSLPGQPATPQGPATVCNNATSDYSTSGSTYADDYTWTLDPPEAGIVTPDANACTIAWSGSFTGNAGLTVAGVNECGTGTASDGLQITVDFPPAPSVSGLNLVCNDDDAEYSTPNNPASAYEWMVTGGTITSGTGTAAINVHWGNPGNGTVSVTETSAAGCQVISEPLIVTIDDCTGIGEGSITGICIYPNPARDKVQITGLDNARVRIYNLLGKEVLTIDKANDIISLNISNLEKGIYLVKIEQDGSLKVVRLIRN